MTVSDYVILFGCCLILSLGIMRAYYSTLELIEMFKDLFR